MTRQFNVVIEKDADGFFVASVPVLRGCHTQAKSLDDLMERIREAIELCIEVSGYILLPTQDFER
ncbi:MAG: type II toxin-antitoxin system HicB family antitoxin [Gammaproteobacteria bacterium]|nr:type II toxin-antitoxin system HicB family antitoxin [Gammaproteobacteria bacterium]NNJ84847.1 type II toxin-antitoxin system HicB family antitoxin [Gammaproteobacteria bacterium]